MKMAESDRWKKPVVLVALLLCLLSFFLMVYAGYEYSNNTDEKILEEAKKEANTTAQGASENISSELNNTSILAEGIAKDLQSGKLKNDSMIETRIRDEIKGNNNILSIGVAYSPDAYKGTLHSFHFKRNGSAVVNAPIEYDYTNNSIETAVWYTNAMGKKHAVWNEPYFGVAANTYLLVYSVPFYLEEFKNGSEAAGIVAVCHSLEGVRAHVVENLDLGDTTGYGFILSEEEVIISYPVQEYLFGNINELAEENKNLYLINKNMKNGEINNLNTGQSSWVFCENISSTNLTTNWTLGIVLPKEEILLNKEIEQDRSVINFVLASFAFIFFLSLLLVSLYGYDNRRLWLLALIFSFLCVLGVGIIWHLTLNESSLEVKNGDIVVFDMADVETVMLHYDTNPKAPRIPTGVFIQSMEFSTANEIVMTGYVWQNISGLVVKKASSNISSQESYGSTTEMANAGENSNANNSTRAVDVSQDISKLVIERTYPSFSFPESKETTIEKDYVDEDKGIIGWRFKTTMRQQFDYSRYPFDEEDVWIKFWNEASEGSVLVPDFDSYDSLIPETLPGLENSLVLEGWDSQKTFFSYRVNSYNTNFGVEDFEHANVSELYFNVGVRRDLKAPFVSDLLPIMVVAILLFSVLAITTREEQKNQFGFSSSGVLAYCAALFFVLIVSHSSLRANIPTDNIIYLEYFFLIMYLAILGVSLNSIAFASHVKIPFIDAKDNLYVKVLYWPVIMGALLVITLLNFY